MNFPSKAQVYMELAVLVIYTVIFGWAVKRIFT